MYKKSLGFVLLIFFGFLLKPIISEGYGQELNYAFQKGEKLHYRVFYDGPLFVRVHAGKAILELSNNSDILQDRKTFHAISTGFSNSTFDMFFKVRDRFESWFDEETLKPYRFIRRTNEGGYVVNDDVDFDYKAGIAKSRKKKVKIKDNTQDLVSAYYFARNLDISHLKIDDVFPLDFYLDDSVYTSAIVYKGIEIVETRIGKFRCMKFLPMVITGEVFGNPYPMSLYISDDKNRIPVLIKSEIVVGSVKAEITEYEKLKYPLDSKIE
jgi:hypothetical protein